MVNPEDNFLSIYLKDPEIMTVRVPLANIQSIEFGKKFLICQDKDGVIHNYNYHAIAHFHYPIEMVIARGAKTL